MAARPLIDWDIFDFSFKTAEQNSTKLDRKQDLNVLYQVCVFRADQKKQDGRPAFSTSPLKPLNGIQRNLTGSKVATSSSNFLLFGPIGKTRWPPWSLIGWDIIHFPSENRWKRIQRNLTGSKISTSSTKCVFWMDRENKMAALAAPWNHWTEFNETCQEARSHLPLPSLCFLADRKTKMAAIAEPSTMVAHFTQARDMWHFGPLVFWTSVLIFLLPS